MTRFQPKLTTRKLDFGPLLYVTVQYLKPIDRRQLRKARSISDESKSFANMDGFFWRQPEDFDFKNVYRGEGRKGPAKKLFGGPLELSPFHVGRVGMNFRNRNVRNLCMLAAMLSGCLLRAGLVQGSDPEAAIAKAINEQSFSHGIDDTRTSWARVGPIKTEVGKAGVEYLLDGCRLSVNSVHCTQVPGGLLNSKYRITVCVKTSGSYKEKHFRGVGHEYHTKKEHSPRAEIEFVFSWDGRGLQLQDTQVVSHEGAGRSLEMIIQGGGSKIAAILRPII